MLTQILGEMTGYVKPFSPFPPFSEAVVKPAALGTAVLLMATGFTAASESISGAKAEHGNLISNTLSHCMFIEHCRCQSSHGKR
jgi:hypothetical protein